MGRRHRRRNKHEIQDILIAHPSIDLKDIAAALGTDSPLYMGETDRTYQDVILSLKLADRLWCQTNGYLAALEPGYNEMVFEGKYRLSILMPGKSNV